MSSPVLHRAPMSNIRFAARAAIVLGMAAALVLLWHLTDSVLLSFAGVLVTILGRLLAGPLDRYTPLPYSLCLALSGMLVIALLGWAVFLFGSKAWGEFDTLLSRVQQGSAAIRDHLSGSARNLPMPLLQRWLVSVPPALMLLGIAAFELLFGVVGVIVAAPVVVALCTAIRKLYMEGTPGEASRDGEPRRVAAANLSRSTPEVSGPPQANRRALPRVHALTLAQVLVVLLAVTIVGGEIIERVGGTVPWPRWYALPTSLSVLTLVYLSALRHRAVAGRAPMHPKALPGQVSLRPPTAKPSWAKPGVMKPALKPVWLRGVHVAAKRFRAFSWKGGLP